MKGLGNEFLQKALGVLYGFCLAEQVGLVTRALEEVDHELGQIDGFLAAQTGVMDLEVGRDKGLYTEFVLPDDGRRRAVQLGQFIRDPFETAASVTVFQDELQAIVEQGQEHLPAFRHVGPEGVEVRPPIPVALFKVFQEELVLRSEQLIETGLGDRRFLYNLIDARSRVSLLIEEAVGGGHDTLTGTVLRLHGIKIACSH